VVMDGDDSGRLLAHCVAEDLGFPP
jgi:hypothetical protein